jgi:peptide/nickel transport system substrate-binding protein
MALRHEASDLDNLRWDLLGGRISRREALRRASLLGLSATALASLVSAPSRSASALPARQDDAPVRGGTVRVAMPGSADTLDPGIAYIAEATAPCEHLYSSLIRLASDLSIEPDLAVAWESNDAADRWTFTLREGVLWHDGSPFTSDDVVATVERIADPEFGSPFAAAISMIERVEATGPTEVVFHLNAPYGEFVELHGNYFFRIVPAGKLDTLSSEPIGTGPYMLAEYVPGERTVLRRFDGYFDPEGQGFLDEIQYLAVPEEATKAAALTSGNIELANEFLPTTLPILEGAPNVTTAEVVTGNHQPLVMDVTQAPFDDVRVRTALKLCAQRDGFVAVVLQGHGETAADQPVPPVDPMYGDIPIPAQDIDRAIALLAEAGFPDGLDVELHTSTGRAGMQESAIAFKDMAAAASVRVEITSHPIDVYWADIWKHVAFCTSNWNGRPTAEQMLSQVYLCGTPGGESNWCNPEFDDLIMAARSELDPDARREILTGAQTLMAEDGPVVVPYFRSYITAYTSRLMGFDIHPLKFLDLRRAWLTQ